MFSYFGEKKFSRDCRFYCAHLNVQHVKNYSWDSTSHVILAFDMIELNLVKLVLARIIRVK